MHSFNRLRPAAWLVFVLPLLAANACQKQPATPPAPAPAPATAPTAVAPPAAATATYVAPAELPAVPADGELGGPVKGISDEGRKAFLAGRAEFFRVYDVKSGLGPYYNETSCSHCHNLPTPGGGGSMATKGRIRMAQNRQALPYPRFAIPGFEPMVEPRGAPFTDLKPPPLYGMGLIEGVPHQVIVDGCDPDDKNHDGISGRVSPSFTGVPGRFGAKAFTHTIEDFAVDAFAFEIGMTGPQRAAWLTKDTDAVADPEITPATVALVAGYIRGLAPPPRNGDHPAGGKLFESVGCVACHRQQTAPNVAAFSDLCVHDLGPTFNDPINDPGLGDSEWRTAPLWGLRLRTVYFHDGRTDNLDAAIRMHAGEATQVIQRYSKLTDLERLDLMQFLATL